MKTQSPSSPEIIPDKLYFKIGEVSQIAGVASHVLRFWESEFPFLKPDKDGFGRIVYISCNPQTLRENLAALAATHDIERFALFDQFPYTRHLECGVTLQRRTAH